MIVVKPVPVTDVNLVTSSIAEPNIAKGEIEWVNGTTYNLGDKAIKSSTHRQYEVVADPSTDDDPEVGIKADPATWIDVGATNRWKMFDSTVGYQSVGDNLTITVTNQPVINSVSGFNITGSSTIQVQVLDGGNLVYDRTVNMIDESEISGWWDFFFESIIAQTRFILTDLPFYPDATMIVRSQGTDVGFGEIVMGRGVDVGETQYGTGWQGLDFSIKERDSFGNYNVLAGRTADLFDYDIKLDKSKFAFVRGTLKSLTGVPTVWIGNPDDINDGTAVFGYYRDAQINFTSPSKIDMTVQVEGLV